jgi:hypothetical protein
MGQLEETNSPSSTTDRLEDLGRLIFFLTGRQCFCPKLGVNTLPELF